jgi:hypothetical protein
MWVGGCLGRGGGTVVPEATHGMTTTRQNTKLRTFLVRACPTAEQECPFAALGDGPSAEATTMQVETEGNSEVKMQIPNRETRS